MPQTFRRLLTLNAYRTGPTQHDLYGFDVSNVKKMRVRQLLFPTVQIADPTQLNDVVLVKIDASDARSITVPHVWRSALDDTVTMHYTVAIPVQHGVTVSYVNAEPFAYDVVSTRPFDCSEITIDLRYASSPNQQVSYGAADDGVHDVGIVLELEFEQ